LPNRLTKRKERKREESKNFATREEVILWTEELTKEIKEENRPK
jgi:hypothetical protein